MRVLDASAFIKEYNATGRTATVPRVREELTAESGYRFDALEGSGMHVHVPDTTAIEHVERTARDTGDLDELSETDVRLLAATLELDGTLVTDDYAMQNVAEKLSVGIDSIDQEGITEERDWQFQCVGCGRVYDDDPERCPICGSECTRKRP
ncbi:NOB1 family endonuclease [Halocatena pleomorpha]|uniref:NOB1 family endonuclease n=1 Tax=Halocatena pleomorpha TaxID=1785090 RepID=A0A3P3RFN9_9EURY|nr:NOB1 family endonuclease [Halocatena pleomorpha]RRJ32336.1 NOB1 family endonuclease [Halocatena pleomorpha]